MENKISGTEDKIEEIDSFVNNVKSKKNLSTNIHKIWCPVKRQNLEIIRIEEGQKGQVKNARTFFFLYQKKKVFLPK